MFYRDLGDWAENMLENFDHYNEQYKKALEDIQYQTERLWRHNNCHNNPEWDCACEEPTTAEFTYAMFDYLFKITDRASQGVATQVLIDYLQYKDNQSSDVFWAHQQVAQELDDALRRIEEMKEESNGNNSTESD